MRSLVKDVVMDVKYEIRKAFPTEKEIKDEIFCRLMEQVEDLPLKV